MRKNELEEKGTKTPFAPIVAFIFPPHNLLKNKGESGAFALLLNHL